MMQDILGSLSAPAGTLCASPRFLIQEEVYHPADEPRTYIGRDEVLHGAAIYRCTCSSDHFILEGRTTPDHPRYRVLTRLPYDEREIADGAPYRVSARCEEGGERYYFEFTRWSGIEPVERALCSDESAEQAERLLSDFLQQERRRDIRDCVGELVPLLRADGDPVFLEQVLAEIRQHCLA